MFQKALPIPVVWKCHVRFHIQIINLVVRKAFVLSKNFLSWKGKGGKSVHLQAKLPFFDFYNTLETSPDTLVLNYL